MHFAFVIEPDQPATDENICDIANNYLSCESSDVIELIVDDELVTITAGADRRWSVESREPLEQKRSA